MDKYLPANAGDMGLMPAPGRFHMPWSNSACAPQQEMRSPCTATEQPPLAATRESPRAATKTQHKQEK